jgi:uncharacterized protein YfaS (alpha-2-macroglobulin family)
MSLTRLKLSGVVIVAALVPVSVAAQDSVRVLRFSPANPATGAEPVVVTFDHPVAPKLDASVDPSRAVTIAPEMPARKYWRDPSTLVVDFASFWRPASSYVVTLNAALTSATGLPLSRAMLSRRVAVRSARVLGAMSSIAGEPADTIPRPVVVYDGPVQIGQLDSIATVQWRECGQSPPMHLRPVLVRPVNGRDVGEIREVGPYDRDRRLDSLHRVVEFVAPHSVPRGCVGRLVISPLDSGSKAFEKDIAVRRPFGAVGISCTKLELWITECRPGPLSLDFTEPVSEGEVRAHVRVDGQPAKVTRTPSRTRWQIWPALQPRREYVVEIDSSLRSDRGEALPGRQRYAVPVLPFDPGVGYAIGSFLVPRDESTLLRIKYCNVDSVFVVARHVADSARPRALAHGTSWNRLGGTWRSLAGDSIVLRYAVHAPQDSEGVLSVAVAALPNGWWDGSPIAVRAMFVPTPEPAPYDRTTHTASQAWNRNTVPQFTVLRRSGLALHVYGGDGDVRAWVTTLNGARPLARAQLRLLGPGGQLLARGTTDERGLGRLIYPAAGTTKDRMTLLEVRQGDDTGLLLLTDPQGDYGPFTRPDLGDDNSQYWMRYADRQMNRWHGAAFTERGIYRPGERVYLKGIVRRYTASAGYDVPRGDSARWLIRWTGGSGDPEHVWTHVSRLGAFGTVIDTFVVPRTARLGQYTAALFIRAGGRWRGVSEVNFAVAEYRPAEFEVSASADTSTPHFAHDTLTVRIGARYLFGLPMDGAKAEWWATTREDDSWTARVRGLEGMAVGRFGDASTSTQSTGPIPLDHDGQGVLRIPIGRLSRPGHVLVSTAVTDVSRQSITRDLAVRAHPADVYLGLRVVGARWSWPTHEPIPVRILTVDARGARRPGVAIRIAVLRYQHTNAGGWQVADTVWRGSRTSTADTLQLAVAVAEPGLHEILLAARDANGREATTGLMLWVDSRDRAPVSSSRYDLEMSADKQRYQPGDSARVRVVSPFSGPALLTLSHEGVLSQEVIELTAGPNTLTVPIPVSAVPSLQVTVIVLNPAARPDTTPVRALGDNPWNPPAMSPYYRRGDQRLEIGRAIDELRVTIRPDRAHYQPRDSVKLQLAVRDAGGRPARGEIAVWAVDQGVAMLTDLAKPDVLGLLLAPAGDPFTFSTTLTSLNPPASSIRIRGVSTESRLRASAVGASLSQVVTTGTGTTTTLREFFSTTPFYRGVVTTDRLGHAIAGFRLPDNLTTFRLFAAVVDQGVRAGTADTSIVSTQALAVRAALPRVVRVGDTLFAGAVVTQDRDGRTPVKLHAEGLGVQLSSAAIGDTLVGRAARELRLGMHGVSGDTVTLRFTATTAHGGDAVQARLPVSPGGHARAHVVMGTLSGLATPAFSLDERLDTLRSRLEVQVGSSPLPLLERLSESLRLYPYYCTEQLASAGRGLMAKVRAERLLDPDSRLGERDRRQLEGAVATIVARQRDDGGFGYWSATNWTSPWLTAYALEFLGAAQAAGVDVPAGAIVRGRDYLVSSGPLALRRSYPDPFVNRDSLIYAHEALTAALTLRAWSQADTALERRILGARAHFDWVDRLLLAQLLAVRGDSMTARQLVSDAWRSTRIEGRRITVEDSVLPSHWLFRSVLRPTATLLKTAAALTPDDRRLEPLLESLIQVGRSERRWSWNTIDQTLAAEAVLSMLERSGSSETTAVTLGDSHGPRAGDRVVTASRSRSDTIHAAVATFLVARPTGDSVALRLSGTSKRPVYYAATLFEVPITRPVRADDAGISVERWYERFDDQKPIVSVREGELVRIRIRITVPADREFVAIEDPLPAGLEAVDLSLRTSGSLPPFAGAPHLEADERAEGALGQRWLYGSWDGGWWTPWEHREMRDDRVLYFARQLWAGSYLVSYVARATTAGVFVRPPAHAEEMYNPAVHGRSDGGTFTVETVKR